VGKQQLPVIVKTGLRYHRMVPGLDPLHPFRAFCPRLGAIMMENRGS
jgi:hypothetical protein